MSKRFKSGIAFIAAMAIVFVAFASVVSYNSSKTKALADAGETVITLKIGKSEMTVNGEKQSIDNSVRFGKAVDAGDDIDKWLEKLNVNHSQ